MGNEYLLISGSPRSGTTMLASHLNSLADVSVLAEFSLTRILRAGEAMFDKMEDRQFSPFDPNAVEQFRRPTRTEHFDTFVRNLWEQVYPNKRPRLLGNKIPALASTEEVDYLLDHVPDLKFVHIVRNCADVVASEMTRAASQRDRAAGWLVDDERDAVWEWVYGLLVAQYVAQRGAAILFVKYEDLIADPHAQAKRLEAFLGSSGLQFTIAQPDGRPAAFTPQAVTGYPSELQDVIAGWADVSVDRIGPLSLALTRNYVAEQWQPLKQPFCDIGTLTNCYSPEPWGVWSKPGYFTLRPRFVKENVPVSEVQINFAQEIDVLSQGGPRLFIDGMGTTVELRALDKRRTLMVGRFQEPKLLRAFLIEVFCIANFRFEGDPRILGTPGLSYKIVYA